MMDTIFFYYFAYSVCYTVVLFSALDSFYDFGAI